MRGSRLTELARVPRDEADEAGQREPREQIRLREADARGRRRELALGGADVGTALQQFVGRADRERRELRRDLARRELAVERAGL